MTQAWQTFVVRSVSHLLAVCAVAFVLFVTLVPSHAQELRVADVTPLAIPTDLLAVRAQPAQGATILPGEQPLTAALLVNYVERQEKLRAFDVEAALPGALNQDVLLGYIARGSLGGGNGALSAIDSFAMPTLADEPALNATVLSAYVASGYQSASQRLDHANAERGCLAQAIYHEARGESAAGQLAVANVIVNRARSAAYPSTLCGVIYQNANLGKYRCQFTFACDGRNNAPGERSAWARSQELANTVYAEFATGASVGALPGSALFYHTTSVRPSWSNTYNQVAQIGSHIFYAKN